MTDQTPPSIQPPAAADPPPRATVAPHGSSCRFCGYDIGGLATGGGCPECGAPVIRSLKGNLFEYANPRYLRSLRTGARVLFLAIITFSVVENLMELFAGLSGMMRGLSQSGAPLNAMASSITVSIPNATSPTFLITQVIVKSLAAYVSLLGWWLLSEPDPGARGTDPDQPARRFLRYTLIANAVLTTIWLVIQLHPSFVNSFVTATSALRPNQNGRASPGSAFAIFSSPFFITNSIHGLTDLVVRIVRFFAALTFMRTLARRIPDESLSNLAGAMRWVVPVLYVVLFCIADILVTVIYAVLLDRFQAAIGKAIIRANANQSLPAEPS